MSITYPNSFNSKCLSKGESLDNLKVKILQKWNGYRPSIVASEILYNFQTYLIQKMIDAYNYNYRQKNLLAANNNKNNNNSSR